MKDWKLVVIIILCIIASAMTSLWYRANQVIELKVKVERTEELLKTVNWGKPAREYLRNIGYDILEPAIPTPPVGKGKLK